MAKRARSWDDTHERQLKRHINITVGNENNSAYMNKVFEKTYSLLFEGAKKAQIETVNLTEDSASSVEADSVDGELEGTKDLKATCHTRNSAEANFMEHYINVSTSSKQKDLTEEDATDDMQNDTKLSRYKQLSLQSMWSLKNETSL